MRRLSEGANYSNDTRETCSAIWQYAHALYVNVSRAGPQFVSFRSEPDGRALTYNRLFGQQFPNRSCGVPRSRINHVVDAVSASRMSRFNARCGKHRTWFSRDPSNSCEQSFGRNLELASQFSKRINIKRFSPKIGKACDWHQKLSRADI